MFLAFSLSDIVTVPFGFILKLLYDLTTNYGVAIILFSILVKLVLLPMNAKGKKSTMKMSRLTPDIERIKKKYPDDTNKQQQLTQELYKKEGVSTCGGCIWSFMKTALSILPLAAALSVWTAVPCCCAAATATNRTRYATPFWQKRSVSPGRAWRRRTFCE